MSHPHSVARTVAARGTAILLGSLVVLGLATAAVLHVGATRALDQALLAAAHENAHPQAAATWDVEHSVSPVEVWIVGPAERRVPPEVAAAALDDEQPRFLDAGDERILLLPVERRRPRHRGDHGDGPPDDALTEGRDDARDDVPDDNPRDDDARDDVPDDDARGRPLPRDNDAEEDHLLVAAAAPRMTLARSAGAFALAYGALAAVVAAAASWGLARTVRGAFAPLDRARAEAEAVLGFGQGRRLTEDAPEELRELLVALNGLLDRLDGAWAAQARFTAEAAHELRTPVAAMLGELDVLLRRERDAAAYREGLVSTREEVMRLRRIVEALTAMARLDTGETERTREAARAGELAERAMKAERRGVEEGGGVLTLVVTEDAPLECNVPLLELALANLLRNAGRHARGARVELRVAVAGPHVVFEVHDAGPGLPADEREAVFARFTRGGEARRKDPEGLGLGLAFAREVARRHGGDCELGESELGGLAARLWVRRV